MKSLPQKFFFDLRTQLVNSDSRHKNPGKIFLYYHLHVTFLLKLVLDLLCRFKFMLMIWVLTRQLFVRWAWTDGSVVDYLSWDDDEPNNEAGNENCVDFNTRTKKWNDVNCNRLKNFICQIKYSDLYSERLTMKINLNV